jgi:hypothetical protein
MSMNSPQKRVAFAPEHESVQRGPEATLFQPHAGWLHPGGPAQLHGGEAARLAWELGEARRRVQQLEAALQTGAGDSTGALGGVPRAVMPLGNGTPPVAPPNAPLHVQAPGPVAAGKEKDSPQLKSTFLLPEVFGGTQFDGREQVQSGSRTRLRGCGTCRVRCEPGVMPVAHTRCTARPAWQPVPLPPPGWAWQWEYAGYRNKDGTITSEPKAKGNGRFRAHDMPCPDADWKG